MDGAVMMYDPYNGAYAPIHTNYLSYNTLSKAYWERSLFQRLKQLFTFRGLPDAAPGQVQTDYDAFVWGLFTRGFLCMFQSKTYGITFQPATPHGIGLQFQPTGLMVATPYFQFPRPLVIGEECEAVKLTPDYRGMWDIVEKYANELLLNDLATRMAQINARFAYAIAAGDEAAAQSAKAILEKLENGEPGIVYNPKINRPFSKDGEPVPPWFQFDRDLKKNFILPELLQARRTILADFHKEIGVASPPEKRERLITSEVETANSEAFTRLAVWKQCLTESLDRCNRLFGTNITFTYNGGDSNDVPYAAGKPADE